MAGSKRSKGSFDSDNYYEQGSSKRVRFAKEGEEEGTPTDFEFDHEESLEPAKRRRGAINTEELSDEEEVGGGIDSSDSEDEESDREEQTKAPGEDFDMFADVDTTEQQEDTTSKGKGKGKGKRTLELADIEGQEFDSRDRDWDENDDDGDGKKEPPITAFNMRQEMDEGTFDKEGNYIPNKRDPQAFHDRWLEGVTRKEMARAKNAQERRQQAEALKEAARQAELPQTKTEVYRELVQYIAPGDTVSATLAKLGGGAAKKVPAWKQKLLDKKNKKNGQAQKKKTEEEAVAGADDDGERRRKVERITALADQMMALGHFGIYDDTFEHMVRYLRREGAVPEDWLPETAR